MRISVGPAPCSWGEERFVKFYREVACSPVDDVYVSEVACPERWALSSQILRRIETMLTGAGKTVYLSSCALVTSAQERGRFDETTKAAGPRAWCSTACRSDKGVTSGTEK